MKYSSTTKIAGFLNRLFGEDEPEPEWSDRAKGMGLAAATTPIELMMAGAVSSRLANPPITDLENSPALQNAARTYMRDNQNANPTLNRVTFDAMRAGGKGAPENALYNSNLNEIRYTSKTPQHHILHELGHASNRENSSVRALNALNMGGRTPYAGLATALAMGGTGNETLETWAPAATAAVHTPQLLEEGRAWLNADKALRNVAPDHVEDPSKLINTFRRRGLGSMAGYGLTGAINVGAAYKLPSIIDGFADR